MNISQRGWCLDFKGAFLLDETVNLDEQFKQALDFINKGAKSSKA